jgi:hypothetical protein
LVRYAIAWSVAEGEGATELPTRYLAFDHARRLRMRNEQLEDLGLDRHERVASAQLTRLRIQCISLEKPARLPLRTTIFPQTQT